MLFLFVWSHSIEPQPVPSQPTKAAAGTTSAPASVQKSPCFGTEDCKLHSDYIKAPDDPAPTPTPPVPAEVAEKEPSAPPPVARPRIDKSPSKQWERQQLLEKLVKLEAFQKYERVKNGVVAWITPTFYTLDFDQKQNFVGVIYAYYYDGNNPADIVLLVDNKNGKPIGEFTLPKGLEIY